MLDKAFVERFFRLNGISIDAPEEEIRTALASAKWHDEEINAAVTLLRNPDIKKDTILDAKKKSIFRPDFEWSSEALSSLLGVDVVVDPSALRNTKAFARRERITKMSAGATLVLISLVLALSLGLFVAYSLDAGPFHASADDRAL